jgi:hypothetical protein
MGSTTERLLVGWLRPHCGPDHVKERCRKSLVVRVALPSMLLRRDTFDLESLEESFDCAKFC